MAMKKKPMKMDKEDKLDIKKGTYSKKEEAAEMKKTPFKAFPKKKK